VKAGGKQSSAFMLVSCSAYSSTLKMEAICSSETSVDFQRNARRYIPEDSTVLKCVDFKKWKTENSVLFMHTHKVMKSSLSIAIVMFASHSEEHKTESV
jgi:hypothetical protein